MASKEKKILERTGLPLWGWAVGAVLVIAVILLGYRTVEAERQLKAAQSEMDGAMEGKVKAKSEAANVVHVAKSLRTRSMTADRRGSGHPYAFLEQISGSACQRA
jgi:hypothetical protein